VKPLVALAGAGGAQGRVLLGPDGADDAGVYQLGDHALVATVDFIMPVCDDPRRFGRVAAANSLSDVWAMGGAPLFALNLCCFPADDVPTEVLAAILGGGAQALRDGGAALLGGHSVRDPELKYGLAVVGLADPTRLMTLAGARPGETLILTKPIGTGVLVNAFKAGKLDESGLEPALVEMERLNQRASELALAHEVRAATDVTGFGLLGHALGIARASQVRLRIDAAAIPIHDGFAGLVERGVTTGCTQANRDHVRGFVTIAGRCDRITEEALHDPQTSGGLLVSVAPQRAGGLLAALLESGHRAAIVGEVLAGPPHLEVV
jgi:selenide,water dikinase